MYSEGTVSCHRRTLQNGDNYITWSAGCDLDDTVYRYRGGEQR